MADGKKLTAKEITTAGALGAVIIVIRMIAVALGGVSPYVWFFVTHPAMAIATAPVFMLLVSKSRKNGAFLMISIVFGVIMAGSTWIAPVAIIAGGFICELCLKKSNFGNGFWTYLGFFFFHIGIIAEFFPLWFTKEEYLKYVVKTMSQEYADILEKTITSPVMAIIIVLEIVGTTIGYFFSKKLMKKHFEKAGLA